MLDACPACRVPLASGAVASCPRCGLLWCDDPPERWIDEPSDVAPSAGPDAPLTIAGISSLALLALCLCVVPLVALGGSIVAAVGFEIAAGALREDAAAWLALIVAAPLGVLIAVLSVRVLVGALRAYLLPDRFDATSDALRVRVTGRWGLRTDARFVRGALAGARLRTNQHATMDVWVVHASGPLFRVVEATSAGRARRVRNEIEGWLAADRSAFRGSASSRR